VITCDARNQVIQDTSASSSTIRQFSSARFRALLALWCARNHRPYELVQDELFGAIIDELRPGALLPDSTTLSRDVKGIYHHNMASIRQYFEVYAPNQLL
jgi:hypothetical protein